VRVGDEKLVAFQADQILDPGREQVHLLGLDVTQVAAHDRGLRVTVIEEHGPHVKLIVDALGSVVAPGVSGEPGADGRSYVTPGSADLKLSHLRPPSRA
jgi:hypothetical protein